MNRCSHQNSPAQMIPVQKEFSRQGSASCWRWLLLGVVGLLAGCNTQHLDRTYGRSRGTQGGQSVNGTAVLSNLLEKSGHKVITKSVLSPSIKEADTIVWVPNQFGPPSGEAVTWMREWMIEHPGTTLVYVGRDYDASLPYWDKMIPLATDPEVKEEMKLRRKEAAAEFAEERQMVASVEQGEWFSYDPQVQQRSVTTLQGPWSQGVDASKVEIELYGRLEPVDAENREVLLRSNNDILVSRFRDESEFWGPDSSDVIVVANGSFLLNASLVNHEHRKLAGKLVQELDGKETVVFLESGPWDVGVLDEEPPKATTSGLQVFTVWPLNIIMVHLALIGLLFCFARWPIFGRPGRLKSATNSDFGAHIEAVGKLLERTGDQRYVSDRYQSYQQSQHGESSGQNESGSPPSGKLPR